MEQGAFHGRLGTAGRSLAIDPDAARQGVYLALWYGNGEKVAGLSDATLTTAAELKEKILAQMPEELRRRIDVVVLDLSRPSLAKPKTKRQRAGSTAGVKA